MAKAPKIDPKRPQKGKSLLAFPDRYVMLDIETTGLDPEEAEIIEIAACRVINDEIVDTFSTFVHPYLGIPAEITQLTSITNEMVADAPLLRDAIPQFYDFIGDDIIAGHNVGFDISFLYDGCMNVLGKPLSNDYVDTLRISRKLYPGERYHSLATLKERFFLESEHDHRAISDVHLTIKCLEHMRSIAYDRNITLDQI